MVARRAGISHSIEVVIVFANGNRWAGVVGFRRFGYAVDLGRLLPRLTEQAALFDSEIGPQE